MVTEYRIDINVEATKITCPNRTFVKEVDDFVYGGYVDWIRRDGTGTYVKIQDAWIPVEDWYDKHKFPGARDLTHIARYFYNLGRMDATPDKCLESVFDFDDISCLELAIDCYANHKGRTFPVTVKHQREVLKKLYELIGVDRDALGYKENDEED